SALFLFRVVVLDADLRVVGAVGVADERRRREVGRGLVRLVGNERREAPRRERRALRDRRRSRAGAEQRGTKRGAQRLCASSTAHGVKRSRSIVSEKAMKASRRREASMRSGVPSRAATISYTRAAESTRSWNSAGSKSMPSGGCCSTYSVARST